MMGVMMGRQSSVFLSLFFLSFEDDSLSLSLMLPLLHFCKRWEPAFYELFVSWWVLNGVTGVSGWKRTHSGIDLWELIEIQSPGIGLGGCSLSLLDVACSVFLLLFFSLVLF